MTDTIDISTHDDSKAPPHDKATELLEHGLAVTYEVSGFTRAPHPRWVDMDRLVSPSTVGTMAAGYGDLRDAIRDHLLPALRDAVAAYAAYRGEVRENTVPLDDMGSISDMLGLWTGSDHLWDLFALLRDLGTEATERYDTMNINAVTSRHECEHDFPQP